MQHDLDAENAKYRSSSWRRPKFSRNSSEVANITYGARFARQGGTTAGSPALRGKLKNSKQGTPTSPTSPPGTLLESLARPSSSPAILASPDGQNSKKLMPLTLGASEENDKDNGRSAEVRYFLTSYWSSHFSRPAIIMVPLQSGAGVSSQRLEQPGSLRVLCDLRAYKTDVQSKKAYLVALDAEHLRTVALGCGKDARVASSSWMSLECMCADRVPLGSLCEEVSIKFKPPYDEYKRDFQVLLRVAVAPHLSPMSNWKALGDAVMVRVSGLRGTDSKESVAVLIRKLNEQGEWWPHLAGELNNEVLVQVLRALIQAAESRRIPYETIPEKIKKVIGHDDWHHHIHTHLSDDKLEQAFKVLREAGRQRGLDITERAFRKGDQVRIVKDGSLQGTLAVVVDPNPNSIKIRLDEGDETPLEESFLPSEIELVKPFEEYLAELIAALRCKAFRKGDQVRIMRDGSFKGELAEVLDPNSAGNSIMTKLDGAQVGESYLPSEIDLVTAVEDLIEALRRKGENQEQLIADLRRKAFRKGDRVRRSNTGDVAVILDPTCEKSKIQLEGGGEEALSPTELEIVEDVEDILEGELTASKQKATSLEEQLDASKHKGDSLEEQLGDWKRKADSLEEQLGASKHNADSLEEQLDASRHRAFRKGDHVKILKEGSSHGEMTIVVDPSCGNFVKTQLEGGTGEDSTENFLPTDIELVHGVEEDLEAKIRELRERLKDAEQALGNARRASAMNEESIRKMEEDAERKRLADEQAERDRKQREAEEAERKRLSDEQAERDRKQREADEAERKRLADEEEERRRKEREFAEAGEAERKRLADEESNELRRRLAEEEAEKKRLAAESEAAKRRLEEEHEAKRKAEQDEEERRRAAEEEARRRAEEEEDEKRKAAEEEEARRLAEMLALQHASRTRLRVKILRAQHLRAADIGGKSDPYVVVKMGIQKDDSQHPPFKTDIIKQNLNPEWNQQHIFDACCLTDEILFEVWDHDDGKKDDNLGSAILGPIDFRPDGFSSYIQLGERKRRGAGLKKASLFRKKTTKIVDPSEGPILWVEVEVLPMARAPTNPRCFLKVMSANDLRAADRGGKSDPYCICEIVGKPASRFQTTVKKKTLDPVWGEEREMRGYAEGDDIQIEVYDSDTGKKKGDPLGRIILPCSEFHSNGFDENVPLQGNGAGPNSRIHLAVDVY